MLDRDPVLRDGGHVLCGTVVFVLLMWQPSTGDMPERAFTRSWFASAGGFVVHVFHLILFRLVDLSIYLVVYLWVIVLKHFD